MLAVLLGAVAEAAPSGDAPLSEVSTAAPVTAGARIVVADASAGESAVIDGLLAQRAVEEDAAEGDPAPAAATSEPTSTTATTAAPSTTAAPTTATTAAPPVEPEPPAPGPEPDPTTTTTAPPPPTTQPQRSSVEQAIAAWFPDVYSQAHYVARCESNLNPRAVSAGGGNHGLFQINQVHRSAFQSVTGVSWEQGIYDAYYNSQFARHLYNQSGWRPWGCRP